MRILFMGTPDFALFTLRALVERGEQVVGVVTQPDKPKGRGYALQAPPVKVYAEQAGLPVYQPATLRDGAFDAELGELAPDVIVVVAYGKILPRSVLEYPRYGCINVHGSLLPAYRGAAPMQRAIMDGCAESGVTTMQMAEGLDTGDMLITRRLPLDTEDNFETVHDKLGALGAEALLETLDALRAGTLCPVAQDERLATYAAKITKQDCELHFDEPAARLHDRVRGLSPFPLSFTHTVDGKVLKVVQSRVSKKRTDKAPGTVIALGECIAVACGAGSVLELWRVLPEGKGRMSAADYIRGRRIAVGDILR